MYRVSQRITASRVVEYLLFSDSHRDLIHFTLDGSRRLWYDKGTELGVSIEREDYILVFHNNVRKVSTYSV